MFQLKTLPRVMSVHAALSARVALVRASSNSWTGKRMDIALGQVLCSSNGGFHLMSLSIAGLAGYK